MFRSKFLLPLILFFALPYAYTQMPPFGFWKTGGVRTFQILGLKGGTDATSDAWFADTGNILNIAWEDTTEDTFATTIYDNDGTTVKCATQNVAQNTTSFSFAISTDCVSGFVDGTSYKAKVVAKKGGKDYRAANSLYSFTMDTTAPTVNITSGPGANSTSSSANFVFTNSDATSGVASIECFLDAVSQGACTSPKNLTSLADGNHIFKVKVTDNAGNSNEATYNWNINTLNITGSAIFYGQTGTAWSNTFTVTGGTGAANLTYSLPVAPGGAGVTGNASYSPQVSYTPAGSISYNFTLRATDSISGNTKDFLFQVDAYASGTCVWIGATDSTWSTSTNWAYCAGAAPISTSKIAIYSGAPNMPILSASTTIDSFGLGPGGGTLTINSARTLTTSNLAQTVRSSVIFKGNTSTCTNCKITTGVGNLEITITDGATVEIQSGILMQTGGSGGSGGINVGDGSTHGILKVRGGATLSEWPIINFVNGAPDIVVNGTSANKSVIDFDKVRMTGNTSGQNNMITFQDYYEIKNFDNIAFSGITAAVTGGKSLLNFASCTNALITDTTWTEISMDGNIVNGSGYNVKADGANCSTLPAISIVNSATAGSVYGSFYELDPNNKINWANDAPLLCEWTGAVSTDWNNSGNWTNCANGRGGVPQGGDSAVIPSAPINQPLISTATYLRRFGSGTGGGTVTLDPGKYLYLSDSANSIQSDVKFKGSNTTCTTCIVRPADQSVGITINNNATVTLLTGATIGNGKLYVGDGTTGATLKTGTASGNKNEWPSLNTGSTGFIVEGGDASNKATLDFDGINVGAYGNISPMVFKKWTKIAKFDNIAFESSVLDANFADVQFSDCTGFDMADTAWDNWDIPATPSHQSSYNIRADGTNCSSLTATTISMNAGTNGGWGYGPLYELDPNNKINWTNGTSNSCVWTGTVDTSWTNSGNWSSCSNGRFGYPDQLDTALIPVAANQPTISASTNVYGIGTGTGGGTITVAAGVDFRLTSNTKTIRSDVKLQGGSTTCSTCYLKRIHKTNETLEITDNATLTLLKGIRVFVGQGFLYVGTASESGHIATGPAGAANEWPVIEQNKALTIEGTASQKSSVNFDGINLGLYYQTGGRSIIFKDYYTISKFDNVTFDYSSGTTLTAANYVTFTSCANANVVDTSWSGLTFSDAITGSARNIDASGTSCSSLPTISLTGYSGTGACGAVGAGACAFENDPNSKIDWN